MAGVHSPRSSNRRWFPTHAGSGADLRLGAPSGQRSKAFGPDRTDTRCAGMLGDRAPDGMLRPRLERRGQLEDILARRVAQRDHFDDLRRAGRHRPRLVERDAPDRAGTLEIQPALDQNSAARRARERRDNRHGRRNDERARAGDDQQHQRAVEPRRKGLTKRQRHADGHPHRQKQHQRRVVARESLDERLGRCLLRLGRLDESDDPRQRGVAPEPRDTDVQRSGTVDAPGIDVIAWFLVHGQRLTRDRRLIHEALPGDDRAVEGHLLARRHQHNLADANLVDRNGHVALRAAHQRSKRRQIHQGPNRVPRPIHAAELEPLRQREEEDHGGAFRPLANGNRTDDGDQHEHIDVEGVGARGRPGTPDDVDAAGGNRPRAQNG